MAVNCPCRTNKRKTRHIPAVVAADQDRLSWETIAWKLGVSELGRAPKNGRQRSDDFLAHFILARSTCAIRANALEVCMAVGFKICHGCGDKLYCTPTSGTKTISTWPSGLRQRFFSNQKGSGLDRLKKKPLEGEMRFFQRMQRRVFWSKRFVRLRVVCSGRPALGEAISVGCDHLEPERHNSSRGHIVSFVTMTLAVCSEHHEPKSCWMRWLSSGIPGMLRSATGP